MSRSQNPDWDGSDVLDECSSDPHQLEMPDSKDLTGNQSWERAQNEEDRGGPAENDAEQFVWLEGGLPHLLRSRSTARLSSLTVTAVVTTTATSARSRVLLVAVVDGTNPRPPS